MIDVSARPALVVDRYVAHDADDLRVATAGTQSLPDGIDAGKQAVRETLAHENMIRCLGVVGRIERASRQHPNADRAEIVSRNHTLLCRNESARSFGERSAQRSYAPGVIRPSCRQPR